MTDGNTYAINKHLNEQEDWDALQEVTAELEQAEARIEELEAYHDAWLEAEFQCYELEDKLDSVIWALRPFACLAKHHAADAPEWGPFDSVSAQVSIRYLRDAMITLAAVAGRYKLKGQDDE